MRLAGAWFLPISNKIQFLARDSKIVIKLRERPVNPIYVYVFSQTKFFNLYIVMLSSLAIFLVAFQTKKLKPKITGHTLPEALLQLLV